MGEQGVGHYEHSNDYLGP